MTPSLIRWCAPLLALALARASEAQTPVAARSGERVVLEGFVLGPDGAPARGAVVTSSAGGRAVVEADGRFQLALELPRAAERVQLTALGDGDRSQSTTVALPLAPSGPVDAGVLFLEADDCLRRWVPTFGSQPGSNREIEELVVFDDGTGPALYAAGAFVTIGGAAADRVAKWTGSSWEPLGVGVGTFGTVRALVVFDDGSGPALYSAGSYTTPGGASTHRVVKWDGAVWSPLGGGMDALITALEVFDDGRGPALYAGGDFRTAGGVTARRIARWDGASWAPVAAGTNDFVWDLLAFDDGSGPALYAGGSFTSVNGVAANGIAKWDGTSWSALGNGLSSGVICLGTFDDGSGPVLVAGGEFTAPFTRIARWDGASWSGFGTGMDHWVSSLQAFDAGAGPELYAGGRFTSAGGSAASRIARWDGARWNPLGPGVDGEVTEVMALAVLESAGKSTLFVGGSFTSAGGETARRIAKSDGRVLSPLGRGGVNGSIRALQTFDGGDGTELVVGGGFTSLFGFEAHGVARWNGSRWATLGTGVSSAEVLEVLDLGDGPALYVGGGFSQAGGVPAKRVAKWDGTSWSALGSGMNNPVDALAAFDDGSGMALYAAGGFALSDGSPGNFIARWNGSTWSQVGTGGLTNIFDLAVFDDGSGPALYSGGRFATAGGETRIARWDGTSWSSFGGGVSAGTAFDLQVFDDGNGPALYAAGNLTLPGIGSARMVRWNGTRWDALGGLVSPGSTFGYSLEVFDDGRGPALFSSGTFTSLDGLAMSHVARWDGLGWEPLGRGLSGGATALAVFDDGRGPALWAGGSFESAVDSRDSHLAKWGCFPDTTAPTLACPESVFAPETDRNGLDPGEFVSFTVTASDDLDPAPLVVCVPPSGSFFPRGTTLVHCTATDASGNVNHCKFPVVVEPRARPR